MTLQFKSFGTKNNTALILAHGAGAGMDHPFMEYFATELAKTGLEVILFNFPYMTKRMEDGKKRPPDRAPVLLEHYRELINHIGPREKVFIGGKSMGGRMASMLLAEDASIADGLVLLGYPFHPPGKPEKLRTEHFSEIKKPVFIAQGERDTFGGKEFAESLSLPQNFEMHWLPDGDHGFKPRKASGHTEQENWDNAVNATSNFCIRG
ncbi:alpha/beta fold hydrolase [Kordiimonas laminariae]|uniref:alpha/beta fold hydrolase n=1 Tax=Kordiimonas laminariae TaxID=2917717 RepID=UPI001FF14BBB|nr:alpha/beta fold hydrolase [Kordiimonas laminariae]MCK0070320.1 alpha/beta fold hydrolase [Kordiimonas laminariae]